MKKGNKFAALGILCFYACSFAAVNVAQAGGGLGGGATEATQILNNDELVAQVAQLAEQIDLMVKQLNDMVANTLTIPDQLFRSVGDIAKIYKKVKGVIDKTQGLAYSLGNIDEELKQRFKSYADISKIKSDIGFTSEYRKIAETQMETTRNTMEAIAVSMEELTTSDASALQEIQKKASTAKGRNELIQATNQLLAFMAEDAMKMRHVFMMQSQAVNAAYEAERTESDAIDAQHKMIVSPVKEEAPDPALNKSIIDQFMP
jgi:P-type conjugative transfer protein TrbJ